MSQYADIRRQFNRNVATLGWVNASDVLGDWPVDPSLWLKRYYKAIPFALERQRRLVNHFLVGSDPEFALLDTAGEQYHANNLNLKAGIAFGADSNGRLVECRPKPSRWVLETTASLWSTLKWLSWTIPDSLSFGWRPGAYVATDGLGGHIHFGRKRPQRPNEISALNTLCFYLFNGNIWDRTEGMNRVRHAQGGGNAGYGRLSDVREQPYGYEYRTMPSWLCSPWMSFFCQTLAKLAVFQPGLLAPFNHGLEELTAENCRQRLISLLAFYKGLDDDAQLCYEIWQKIGFPRWSVQDLKAAWGIFGGRLVVPPAVELSVWPTNIPASKADISELISAMKGNRPPTVGEKEQTWQPNKLPKGYRQLIRDVNTTHVPGLGELAVSLCCHESMFFRLCQGGSTQFPNHIHARLNFAELKEKFPDVSFHWAPTGENEKFFLSVTELSTSRRNETLAFLTSGYFPIWELDKVSEGTAEAWEKAHPKFSSLKKAKPENKYPFSTWLSPKAAE